MLKRSLSVYQQIESDVLSGKFIPGERLPSEEKLCGRFNASRTAIREALHQLRGRGLLRTIKGSGTYVADSNPDTLGTALTAYSILVVDVDFVELIDLRILIETECARLAAMKCTPKLIDDLTTTIAGMAASMGTPDAFAKADIAFHLLIARGSGNRIYASLLSGLERRLVAYAQTSCGDDAWYHNIISTHQIILQSIADQSPDDAAAQMKAHLHASRANFLKIQRARENKEA